MENYINSLFSINHALQNGFKSILDKYKVSNSDLPALPSPPPDVLVLERFTYHNGNFHIILQGDIPNQRTLIFDIAAITAGAKIIVHTAQKFHIVWRIPAIHLLADIPVPIPQQGHRIIPIIGGSRIWLPMIRSVILGVLRRLLLILYFTVSVLFPPSPRPPVPLLCGAVCPIPGSKNNRAWPPGPRHS